MALSTDDPPASEAPIPRCPDCGAAVSAGALGGQCAACLFRSALGADEDTNLEVSEAGDVGLAGLRIGRYRLVERVGQGGMGVVYRAVDERLGRAVAFKVVAHEGVGHPVERERFEAEARAASALQHPNVCAVFDVGDSVHGSYLVLPLYEGETLAERLERGPLPVEEALDVVRQTARGLERAHREGIVHGDVKPENLMLTADGQVKILDFGLAGAAGERGRRGGTDGYMPPEAEEHGRLDPRVDLYSLGVVLVDVLLGRSGATPTRLPPRPLEPELDALLARCLAPDPARRIATAREVIEALGRVDPLELMVALGELPSPTAVATSPRARGPSPRATAVTGIALVLGLLLSGWLVGRFGLWSGLAPARSVASLVSTAASTAAAESEPELESETAPDLAEALWRVRWGFELDREAWAQEARLRRSGLPGAPEPVSLWWRASRVPLVGSPIAVRALDLGRVGPSEPRPGPDDRIRLRVGLDGGVSVGSTADEPTPTDTAEPAGSLYGFHPVFFVVAFGVLLAVTVVLAHRNLARDLGDRRGAARLAALLGGLFLVSWIAGGGHSPVLREEFSLGVQAAGLALFYAALAGLFHLALEPRLRRRWPHVQIGWSHLFGGRIADGVAARELLAGALLGVGWFLLRLVLYGGFGEPVRVPNVRLLEGTRQVIGELANSLGTSLALGLGVVVVMALLRERIPPRVAPWVFAIVVSPALALAEPSALAWVFWPAVALSARWSVGRFGALALVSAYLVFRLLWMGMLTPVPGRLGFGLSAGTAVLVLLLGLGPMTLHLLRGRRSRAVPRD